MEKLRVYFDRQGNTLSVWFDDPKKESVCEETDDDVVLVKDREGPRHRLRAAQLSFGSAAQRRREHPGRSPHGLTRNVPGSPVGDDRRGGAQVRKPTPSPPLRTIPPYRQK